MYLRQIRVLNEGVAQWIVHDEGEGHFHSLTQAARLCSFMSHRMPAHSRVSQGSSPCGSAVPGVAGLLFCVSVEMSGCISGMMSNRRCRSYQSRVDGKYTILNEMISS